MGVARGSIPQDWYGGPGYDATATYDVVEFEPGQDDVPGNPKRHLRITWLAAASRGGSQHRPAFRGTFLEYFGIRDVRCLSGETVIFSFYARVADEPIETCPFLAQLRCPYAPVSGE